MCESFYPILLAYERMCLRQDQCIGSPRDVNSANSYSTPNQTTARGSAHTRRRNWINLTCRLVRTLIRGAEERNTLPYSRSHDPLWVTNDRRFLLAAQKAADFLVDKYVEPTNYIGGLNDTTHIKSVKTDAVGVMFCMRSLLKMYETTNPGLPKCRRQGGKGSLLLGLPLGRPNARGHATARNGLQVHRMGGLRRHRFGQLSGQ